MKLKAEVRSGCIVLCDPVELPEGAKLFVEVREAGLPAEATRQPDITDSHAAALRTFFDNTSVGAVEVNAQLRIVRVNKGYCIITGYSEQELVGRDPTSLDHPDERQADQTHALRFMRGEIPSYTTEKRYVRKDGSTVWVQVHASAIRDDQGNVTAAAGLVIDISARKLAEHALQESRRRFYLAAEGSLDGIWDWNIVTGHDYFSERWCQLLGFAMDELEPHADTWLSLLHPDDKEEVLSAVNAHLVERSRYEVDYRLRKKDGTYLWVRASGQARWDDAGKPVRMAGSISDISAQKATEERQKTLDARLLEAQKLESLGLLAGGVAHDFNNLLTSVLTYCDLARRQLPEHSEARTLIGDAMGGAQAAAVLTQQLLAYSGKGRYLLRSLNLSTLVEQAVGLLGPSLPTQCTLTLHIAPDLPMIRGDENQCRQLVINLVTNAAEAIGEQHGHVTVSTRVVLESPERASVPAPPGARHDEPTVDNSLVQYVELMVRDTGIGMSDETQGKMFDPFFSTKSLGRGLGLSASLGIVRGHKGSMTCATELGAGTTFRVLFPARTDG